MALRASPSILKTLAALFENKLEVGDFSKLPWDVSCALVLYIFVPCRALAKMGIQEESAQLRWFCIFKVTRKIALTIQNFRKFRETNFHLTLVSSLSF